MAVLIALKPIRVSGQLLRPGETFRVEDGEKLIASGYARGLTEKEVKVVLDKYVQYAERIFQDEHEGKRETQNKCIQGSLPL